MSAKDNLDLSRSNLNPPGNGTESNEKGGRSDVTPPVATIAALTREALEAEIEALGRALLILESGEDYHPGQPNDVDTQCERLRERLLEAVEQLEDENWLDERFVNAYEAVKPNESEAGQ